MDTGQRQHDQLSGAGQLELRVLLLREAREGARHPGFCPKYILNPVFFLFNAMIFFNHENSILREARAPHF